MNWTRRMCDVLESRYESAVVHDDYSDADRVWEAVMYLRERFKRAATDRVYRCHTCSRRFHTPRDSGCGLCPRCVEREERERRNAETVAFWTKIHKLNQHPFARPSDN